MDIFIQFTEALFGLRHHHSNITNLKHKHSHSSKFLRKFTSQIYDGVEIKNAIDEKRDHCTYLRWRKPKMT